MNDDRFPQRRSLRLNSYDYSLAGAYYVTICTKDRQCLLSTIENAEVRLSRIGEIVKEELRKTVEIRPDVELDSCVIMPNHLHIILFLLGESKLTAVINGLKSAATKQARTPGLISVEASLWQRGFYDHIIRNDADLARIREYIRLNPFEWEYDEENPDRIARRNSHILNPE